jgi:hypothetical protein
MDNILDAIFAQLGLEGLTLFSTLALISLVCRLVGKAIPDDRTGVLGYVRVVCKVLGLYVSNRISSGISVTDVSKVIVDSKLPLRGDDGKFTSQTVEDAAREMKSHWVATVIAGLMILLMVSGCTPTARVEVTRTVCNNTGYAQQLLDYAADTKRKELAQRVLNLMIALCPAVLAELDTRKAVAAGVIDESTI